MPQSIQDVPPPTVEWRRESDDERQQRLMRSGIVQPSVLSEKKGGTAENSTQVRSSTDAFLNEISKLNQSVNQNTHYWFGIDLARWNAVKSPKNTSTVSDGSFGLNIEVTRSDWRWKGFRLGFGPAVVFFNGGQFAELTESPIRGQGYADFSSCEFGGFANFVRIPEVPTSRWQSYYSLTTSYLPVRIITAESQSFGRMNLRSDTYSRTSLSVPGLGLRLSAGMDWSQFVRSEIFYALQGAWPLQLRSRVGLQVSMGLTVQDATAVAQ
ncbi:MAG: hypothetical protein RJB13_928 [Pseudomonadota bacterium]